MRTLFAGAALAMLAFGSALAMKIPAYVTAAVNDPGRPADQVAVDGERKPAEMVAFAGIKPGDVVVDVIPGRGYFTRIFAKVVGPKGRVYAYVPSEFDPLFRKNNIPIPSGTDPNYPNVNYLHFPLAKFAVPERADVIWTSQNYHDMHNPGMNGLDLVAFNRAVYAALKPGGIYLVLDHAAAPGSGVRDTNTLHRIDPAVVKREVLAAGFVFEGEDFAVRNPADKHDKSIFDPAIRGHTDKFVFKFRKPLK